MERKAQTNNATNNTKTRCFYCKKPRHWKKDYREGNRDQQHGKNHQDLRLPMSKFFDLYNFYIVLEDQLLELYTQSEGEYGKRVQTSTSAPENPEEPPVGEPESDESWVEEQEVNDSQVRKQNETI